MGGKGRSLSGGQSPPEPKTNLDTMRRIWAEREELSHEKRKREGTLSFKKGPPIFIQKKKRRPSGHYSTRFQVTKDLLEKEGETLGPFSIYRRGMAGYQKHHDNPSLRAQLANTIDQRKNQNDLEETLQRSGSLIQGSHQFTNQWSCWKREKEVWRKRVQSRDTTQRGDSRTASSEGCPREITQNLPG